MMNHPDKYKNQYRIASSRAPWWDYGQDATYFVTVCTRHGINHFGKISDGKAHLSEIGVIVEQEWLKTVDLRADMNLTLGEFVVMPNHFHGIIIIGKNKYNEKRASGSRGENRGGVENGNGIGDGNVETQCIASLQSSRQSQCLEQRQFPQPLHGGGAENGNGIGGGNVETQCIASLQRPEQSQCLEQRQFTQRLHGGGIGNGNGIGGGNVETQCIASLQSSRQSQCLEQRQFPQLLHGGGVENGNGVGGGNVETQCIASLQPTPSQQCPERRQSLQPQRPSPCKNKFAPQSKNLPSIMRGFKTGVTVNARQIYRGFEWQARYHDRIIRNHDEYQRIENYIIHNPLNWESDKFYSL